MKKVTLLIFTFVLGVNTCNAQSLSEILSSSEKNTSTDIVSSSTEQVGFYMPGLDALEGEVSNVVLVAEVNIYDAKILSQDNNTFNISFDLSNGRFVQPDVRYSVQLVKTNDKGQFIVDETVYPDIVNLNQNQTVKKEVTYVAPDYLNGVYRLWVYASNQNGLALGVVDLGEVTLQGTQQYIEINPRECYLQVEGQDTKYSLEQGVDIAQEETLLLTCDYINHFEEEIDVTPYFKILHRTGFGEEVEKEEDLPQSIKVGVSGDDVFSLTLPKTLVPQAYDIQLILNDFEGKSISNKVTIHYVLHGISATIKNFRLDKNYYKAGEMANLSLYWSGSASDFPQSRLETAQSPKTHALIKIRDVLGKDCIHEFSQELEQSKTVYDFTVPVIQECVDPLILMTIQDDKGTVLDSKEYALTSVKESLESDEQEPHSKRVTLYTLVVLFFLLFTFSLFMYYRKKRSILPVVLIIFSCTLLFGVREVHAETFTADYSASGFFVDGWVSHTVEITMSLQGKYTYNPGENIHAMMRVSYASCANSLIDYSTYIGVNGRSAFENAVHSYWLELDAPAQNSPGSYNATFGFYDNRCNLYGGWCTYYEEIYLGNKQGHLIANGFGYYTKDAIRAAMISAYGSVYNHFITVGGPVEGIPGCKARCSPDRSFYGYIPYTVVAPPPTYSCTGGLPGGAISCGNTSGLAADTPWSYAGTGPSSCNPGAKCQYYIIPSYSCSGLIPDGVSRIMCPGSNVNLTANRNWSEVGSTQLNCSPGGECEYYVPRPLSVTVTAPELVQVGDVVTWRAIPDGGRPPYTYSWEETWTGGPVGVVGTDILYSKRFSDISIPRAEVTVRDSAGTSVVTSKSVRVEDTRTSQ